MSLRIITDSHFHVQQVNILVSNDNPPRACLGHSGFATMILDPDAQLEGGTMMFMPPELLAPSRYGPVATPEADTYAFGLVIFQVRKQGGHRPLAYVMLSRSSQVKLRSVALGRWRWHGL